MVLCHKRQDRSGSLAVIALQEEVARLAQEVQQAEEAPKRRRMCLELFGNRCSRFVSFSLWLELNLDIYLFDLIYIYILLAPAMEAMPKGGSFPNCNAETVWDCGINVWQFRRPSRSRQCKGWSLTSEPVFSRPSTSSIYTAVT